MCSLSFLQAVFLLCSSIFVFSCIYLLSNVVHDGIMTEEQVSSQKSLGAFPSGTVIILLSIFL